MPNYRGLDVLQYECDILILENKEDEISISMLEDATYLSAEDKKNMVERYQLWIAERSKRIDTYMNIISDCSTDPLEYLYQEFLRSNLELILRRIENFFNNYKDALMEDNIIHFSSSAKKVAVHSLNHHAVGYLLQNYLLEKQIKELESPLASSAKHQSAIRNKYEYFSDRLECCLEIGNKIRELSKF